MNIDTVSTAIVSSVLTGGFLYGVARVINAIRGVRSGKLANSGTVIRQLGEENDRLARDNERLAGQRDTERQLRWASDERAARYRLQLVQHGVTPYDEVTDPRE